MCRKSRILMMSLLLGLCIGVYGQTYVGQKELSSIKVLGTSTVHDWHENVNEFSSSLKLDVTDGFKITFLETKVLAESLDSGKSLMDKLTYKALKSEKHPIILFTATQQEKVTKLTNGVYSVLLKGNLSIAGVEKETTLLLEATQHQSEVILKGNKKIKMTDYEMKPPTAMLGTIKTGDEVTIEFTIQYKL